MRHHPAHPGGGRAAVLAVLLAAAVLAAPAPGAAGPQTDEHRAAQEDGSQPDPDVTAGRVAGADRIDTAARVAELTFEPRAETATALVARSDDFPDALAASGLAGLHEGPVLLTRHGEVPARTWEALEALAIDEVVVLGGTDAVSDEVEEALAGEYATERIAGADRFATAAAVARRVAAAVGVPETEGQATILLANGRAFADALTAGPLAYRGAHPILLTARDVLPAATAEALEELAVERAIVLGGPAAVSDQVLDEVEARGVATERIFGADRTATAATFADALVDRLGFAAGHVLLARGDDHPDALSAGPRGGALAAPILLSATPATLGGPTADWLAGRCPDVELVQAVGGEAAVTPQSLAAAVAAAESCGAPEPQRTLTYEIGTRGSVHADVETFRQRIDEALADRRGWALDGDLEFVEVASGGDFRMWLASPQEVAAAHEVCSPQWSCRVGDDVYVNDERWREATATYQQAGRSLTEYRWYVVNHEVGHWLGHGHHDCPGAGQPAPVMQQQSINLQGCEANVWPLEFERERVRDDWLP